MKSNLKYPKKLFCLWREKVERKRAKTKEKENTNYYFNNKYNNYFIFCYKN